MSCRINDVTEVIVIPISEVIDHLWTSNALKLDRLSSEETTQRVVEKDSHWFFQAREGEYGPYASVQTATHALKRHILSAQEEGRTGRTAQA